MKKLIEKSPPLYTMLYYNNKFEGFFGTNQDAWMCLMGGFWRNVGEEIDKRKLPELVDIVCVFDGGLGNIHIASIQTFKLEETQRIYNGVHRTETGLSKIKDQVHLDWKNSITE